MLPEHRQLHAATDFRNPVVTDPKSQMNVARSNWPKARRGLWKHGNAAFLERCPLTGTSLSDALEDRVTLPGTYKLGPICFALQANWSLFSRATQEHMTRG